jgi:Sulfotransferase domain
MIKSSHGRLPQFIIIGSPKAGSTTLYNYFSRHKKIFMCTPKEPNYFSHQNVYSRGLEWYKKLFTEAKSDHICGEASTTYSRWPEFGDVPDRIARVVPEAKMIYIMRNPIDRAYSHYGHHMRRGVTMTFEEALERNPVYVNVSLYMMQIKQYLRFFKPEAFKFLLLDDLIEFPNESLQEVQNFLGLIVQNLLHDGKVHANRGGSEHFLWFEIMRAISAHPPLLKVKDSIPTIVRKVMFSVLKRSPIGRGIMNSYQLPLMKNETRHRLLDMFLKPNEELAAFLGIDLSMWSI